MSAWIEWPEDGHRAEVPEISLPHYLGGGWRLTEAPPKPPKLPRVDRRPVVEPTSAKTTTTPAPTAPEVSVDDKNETPESPKPRRRTSKEGD